MTSAAKHLVPDPTVAVLRSNATDDRTWDDKLASYHELGVRELVRFDPEACEGERLEVWDLVEGDLAPRALEGDFAESRQLSGHCWVVRPLDGHDAGLRLALGGPDGPLLPTPEEMYQRRADDETRRADDETRRADDETRRADTAERRLAELEARLAKRG